MSGYNADIRVIQFYYRSHSSPVRLNKTVVQQGASQILIGSLVNTLDDSALNSKNDVQEENIFGELDELRNVFLISSEHGFNLSSGMLANPLAPWRCTVPSSLGGLRF